MRSVPSHPLETTWEDWLLGGGVRASFGVPGLPLEVEIGPGDDDFLLNCAQAHPDRNWLGIEYSRKRVRRFIRRITERAGVLPNLRLVWRPAADVVGPFLTPEQVQAVHVHFPDPWPKKHHHRYRLLTPAFIADLRAGLAKGGGIHLLTDHLEYAEEMLLAFHQVPGWHSPLAPPGYRCLAADEIATVFGVRWQAQGRTIYRLDFIREA